MLELIAQGTGWGDFGLVGLCIGGLFTLLVAQNRSTDKRNDVIEKLADRSNDVIDRNTQAFTRFESAIRHAPCGAKMQKEGD